MRCRTDSAGRRTPAWGVGGGYPELDVGDLRRVVGRSVLAVAAIQGAAAAIGLPRGRRDYADVAWGPGLAAVAIVGALSGRGNAPRRWGLAAVTTAWAARLAHQMLGRVRRSDQEDPRYTEFLQGDRGAKVIVKVFGTQGVSQLIVSAPIQLAAASRLPHNPRRWLAPTGLAIMIVGASLEAFADQQKDRYAKLDDSEKPDVLDSGLWGVTRHPNYFGDSLVWDGAWLTAAASAPGALTFPAPVLMSYLLIVATGARRTERHMQNRPGYRDYQARVAFFFPRPQRR